MVKMNALNPEQMEKLQKTDAKELSKWDWILNNPRGKISLIVIMVIVVLVYIIDEISTNINLSMQSPILFDLFNITSRNTASPEYASAINSLGFINILSYLFLLVLPFYKALADKYGRKMFLVINTAGMALGMLIVMLANSMVVYAVGLILLAFVTPNDIQTLYIMEVSPPKHRAKLCNLAKALAILGISLIGLLRQEFMTDELS